MITKYILCIQVMRKHGAIPFVRTNVPQMYMSLMTHNDIFGDTYHPDYLEPPRTPGNFHPQML